MAEDFPADADVKIPAADDEIIFVPEVERIVGAHPTTIRRWWQTGQFPAPLRYRPHPHRMAAWRDPEMDQYAPHGGGARAAAGSGAERLEAAARVRRERQSFSESCTS